LARRNPSQLVDAWSRSQFLFDQEVTTFLRKVWVDAVKADYHERNSSRDNPNDDEREESREKAQREPLRKAFLPYLKVTDGYPRMPRWFIISLGWMWPHKH
jgi:hypothetical protein